MNEEIKEILDKLREAVDYPKLNYSSYDKSYNETIDNVAMLKSFACKQLLNYITNIQKENEKLKNDINKTIKYIEEIKNKRDGLSVTEYKSKWRSLFDYYESDKIINDLLDILKMRWNK